MKRTLHLITLSAVIAMGLLGVGGKIDSAHAEPSLPIVRDIGMMTIEIYPLRHKLAVLVQGKTFKTFPIAVGSPSTPTPVGEYKIISKGKDWGPAFGPRWIGLDVPWGVYGIHGTNRPYSIGQHLSHGCIRMRNRDILELFDMIPVGTKVTIYGHLLGDPDHEPRRLAEGDVGGEVQLIQSRLKSAGYFNGTCNGKFRTDTTKAIRHFQSDHHLPVDGVISSRVYEHLGLLE